MLRFAMISKWHVHADGYANFVNKQEDSKVTCVWDENPARGQEWANEMGVDFEPDYDKLLAREDVDAVLVCSPTNMHKELMIKAANAKKHIFTEKVLAFNVKDCDEIIDSINKNGVKFSICFPHRTNPANLFIKNAVDSGLLGDITLMRVRNCHDGALSEWLPDYWYDPETTGGGAMMDLGAHSMYLSAWLLGKPVRIQSMFSNHTGHAVEDNAVCTIEFENKAVAISETSLAAGFSPYIFEVYGKKGSIVMVDNDIKLRTKKTQELVEGGWVRPKLPEAAPHPIRQFIDGVLYGKEIIYDTAGARALSQLMEGAYLSDKEHKDIFF